MTQSFGATVDDTVYWDDFSMITEVVVNSGGSQLIETDNVFFGIRLDVHESGTFALLGLGGILMAYRPRKTCVMRC
ncbi:MAG TPA: hypothetical protein PKE26_15455 [Kiritimatiellia bacterium]|nr:hypothetical protein [Kiritimatiellia bacterium]HMP00491.1 hypothetical protein [Kiritimatiellia bacterium]